MPKPPAAQAAKRKRQIAAGVVAGKSAKQISQETGLTPQSVGQYVARDPEVGSLLMRLKTRHGDKIDQLYTMMLDGIGSDMGHADPDVRFRARQECVRLAALGETKPDGSPDEVAGDMDLEHALFVVMAGRKKAKVIEAAAEVSLD